jgi:O-antigen ligase
LWLLFGFSLVVMILSAQSRGGLIAASVVLVLSTLLYLASVRRQLGGWQQAGILALLALFALAALMSVGIEGLASRLERDVLDRDSDIRNRLALATFDAARQFWPWGSGMGSFETVFPRFQQLSTAGHVTHAHNDYAQLGMELGAPGVGLAVLFAALLLCQCVMLVRACLREGRLSAPIALRSFSGLSLLALLMHSWVEFNMHIPALALVAACLAGLFMRPLERGSRR